MCKELKPIYQAVDADAAERALERFRNTTMGKKYPAIIQIWERAWAQVIPFIQFAPEIRTQIYTINSIEGLNRAVRKVIKTRTLFPNEEAAKKLMRILICVNGGLKHVNPPDSYLRERCAKRTASVLSVA